MFRLTQSGSLSGMQTRWEGWTGVSRDRLLNDDPADGFDLPNYRTGRGLKVPREILTTEINKIISDLISGN